MGFIIDVIIIWQDVSFNGSLFSGSVVTVVTQFLLRFARSWFQVSFIGWFVCAVEFSRQNLKESQN